MSFTIATLTLEAYLLVLVRTATFMASAPIFSHNSINARMRVLISICISFAMYNAVDIGLPEYSTVLQYTSLVIKEALVGLLLGFVSGLTMKGLVVAGEFIDREIGFSMATAFNPAMGGMVTITGEMYDKIVCLIIVLTNMHYYILSAAAQSFELIPIGRVDIHPAYIYTSVISFVLQLYSIGFRIAMPIFLGATILNVILGVLAKSSPQMNMFAVGMQMKVFAGLALLSICILFTPSVANLLMEKMRDMINIVMGGL